ncbi:LysE family translocator [Novosphingobium sp. G106]|uniref:LysE family translocator n=1 Tax=Novosphingobium sp. G106 TaxID=2849500 RepID=UPI001C2D0E4F|nr:LysE family translocator [Novosphingobium sp. G106]MBV1687113.1 LysE family translocator [Novosphingobium sp. G106]
MLSAETLLALAAFAFVSSITPGPNNLMLMASGTNFGLARTVPHMLGVGIGFMLMIFLVGAGLGGVFALVPGSMLALKVASTVYLLYLAYKIATSAAPRIDDDASGSRPFTFLQAAAFQWVNPKAWTMALTAAAVYLPKDDRWLAVAVVAVVFGLVNIPSVTVWAAAGVQLRRLLHRPQAYRAFNIAAALLLVASLYPVLLPSGAAH